MARRLVLAATLIVAALTVSAFPQQALAAPESGDAGAKSAAAPRFNVKSATCADFMGLSQNMRSLMVAWAAGRYHKGDRWIVDEPTATKAVTTVEQECQKSPEASFRYKVVGVVKKLR